MSRSRRLCVLLCFLFLLSGALVFGQQQQGAIFGAVSDASGALVPGVGVEISGPNLIRPLSAVTDEYGAYRFPALPPGIYQIKSEMPGFATYIKDGIELNVGRALKVDIQLKVSEIAETVEVSATAAIDVVKSESAQVLNDQLLSQIPKGRDYRDIARALPGINEEKTGINVDGASGSENVYFIDGIDTTDMYTGTTRNQVPMDFVGELQIKTGGYEAEYGGAMGGVISVVTKSGSNSFHGEVV
jgi:outer membrane receptor protein involved in Fe transport